MADYIVEDPSEIIVVQHLDEPITVVSDVELLVVDREVVSIISELQQGERGPQGIDGNSDLHAIAGESLGGHRAVAMIDGEAFYPVSRLPSGITLNAGNIGEDVVVRGHGEIIEPSWNWSDGPIWLGANGVLTQTPPTTGRDIQIGIATGQRRMLVRIQEAVALAA